MNIHYSSKAGLLAVCTLIAGVITWNAAPVRGFKEVDRQVVFGVAAITAGQTARLNVVIDNPDTCPPTPVELMFIDADGRIEQTERFMAEAGHAVFSDLSPRVGGTGGGDAVGDGSRHRFRAAARFIGDPNIRPACRGAQGTATVELIDTLTGASSQVITSPGIADAGWGANHNETLVRDETVR